MNLFKSTLAIALLASPGAALAHDFWLAPDRYQLDAPGPVGVKFRIGDGASPEPWNLIWSNVVSLRSQDGDIVIDRQKTITPRTPKADGSATMTLETPGTHLISFESNQSLSDLAADRFNAYLQHEGLTAVIAERERTGTTAANGTETYARRSKVLVQVGDKMTDEVLRPIGHTLEIVPEKHPYALGASGRMPVRVFFRGQPLMGARVSLIDLNGDGKPLSDEITDAQGRVSFGVPQKSAWRLNVVWSVPTPESSRASFDTIFSSLTFGYE